MKRLAVLLSLGAVLSLILAVGNYERNASPSTDLLRADGGANPPPPPTSIIQPPSVQVGSVA